jgi:hypothetical protein
MLVYQAESSASAYKYGVNWLSKERDLKVASSKGSFCHGKLILVGYKKRAYSLQYGN